MKKLDEVKIIEIFQKKNQNKSFVPEDVEVFRFGNKLCVSSIDTLVESTDIPPKMKFSEIARKSVVSALSDFAAKGVRPSFAIISVSIPRKVNSKKIKELANGFAKTAKEYNIKILGGDTNEGKEITISVVLIGFAKKIVKRRGAKINDKIFVTGEFGNSAAGLQILLRRKKADDIFKKIAINSVKKPQCRLEFGIKNQSKFSSSMDSSDGLSTCINEMARQSNKQFLIDKLPANTKLFEFASKNKLDPLNLIFNGGEEYEIVFTTSPRNVKNLQTFAKRSKINLLEIGRVIQGNGVVLLHDDKKTIIKDRGWKHFTDQK